MSTEMDNAINVNQIADMVRKIDELADICADLNSSDTATDNAVTALKVQSAIFSTRAAILHTPTQIAG